ncbi:Pentatricopeptide repeat-containing protein [Planoprotostelium fungivorum]|uniref:Pentatricopeptide repeat-containing protein n=1 Tax=Planoprotostelium fungivorum TaxID=1890364 RepID=A0A2P6NX73_9EUKA|nr:Pentatricopeptide repeat-containing protein [Planoprotostelium fungivorum]
MQTAFLRSQLLKTSVVSFSKPATATIKRPVVLSRPPCFRTFATSTISNELQQLCKQKKFEEAQQLMFSNDGEVPSLEHVNIITQHMTKDAESSQKFLPFLEDIQMRGLVPDALLYNGTIRSHALAADSAKVKEVFEEMKKKGFQPDTDAWSAFVATFVSAKDIEGATKAWDTLTKERIKPTSDLCASLINLHLTSETPNLSKAINIFRKMNLTGVKPKAGTYEEIIQACIEKGKLAQASAVWGQMRDNGLRPGAQIIEALAKMYDEAMLPQKRREVLEA